MSDSRNTYLLGCLWQGCEHTGPYSNHQELFEHIDSAHNKRLTRGKFTCEWVGCQFESDVIKGKAGRGKHLITHTQHKPYVCDYRDCDSAFNRKDGLKNHVKSRHGGRDAEDDGESDAESTTDAVPTLFECKTCDRSFDGPATLKLHNDVVHREAHVGKKRPRADSDQGGAPSKKRQKKSSAAPTSSACSTILDVEDWSDEDAAPSTLVHDDDDVRIDNFLVNARLLAVEKRIARLEARLGMDAGA